MSEEIVNVCIEVAEAEFDRIAKYYRIQTNEEKIDAKQLDSYKDAKQEIVEAIQDGAIYVNEDGAPVYVSECEQDFTFRKLIGTDFVRLDKYDESQGMHKGQATVASLTKKAPREIAALDADDWQFMVRVASFLLLSKKRRSRKARRS